MITSDFVSNVVLLSEGKLPTFASGSTKWLRIVAQGNFFLQAFARERGIDWNFYYDPEQTLGTVTATNSFAIPSTVQKVSQNVDDAVRVMHATAFTLDGSLTGAAVTSVVVNETVPTGTPQTGYIRVLRDDGTYTKIAYSAWAANTFTITSTNFYTNNATDGNASYVNTLSYTDYSLVPHDQLKKYATGQYAAKIGANIIFNKEFAATDQQYGGEILVPVYAYPDTFEDDADVIDHPDANWLVLAVAADRVKNDVTRKDLRADLSSQANELMLALKEDNEAQTNDISRPWNPLTTEVWWR